MRRNINTPLPKTPLSRRQKARKQTSFSEFVDDEIRKLAGEKSKHSDSYSDHIADNRSGKGGLNVCTDYPINSLVDEVSDNGHADNNRHSP